MLKFTLPDGMTKSPFVSNEGERGLSGLIEPVDEKGPTLRQGLFYSRHGATNQRSDTTLSETRGSRRSPRYWLDIGSSDTSKTSVAPKPLNAVFIAAP
ncbi:hypothetical protein NVSP9465_01883 [Novosphingobium sp. CECT 9465]|nr:hypothetical protein NVSP9465_01883 [Novosphingobium sp. CECT 9465]